MTTPLIKTKKLYLQKDFPEQTERWLRLLFGVTADEKLRCAVWTSPFARRGFLITDKAIRWSVVGADGTKANGALLKAVAPQVTFTITPAVSDANATRASRAKTAAEELSRLEIAANGRTFTFFVKGLTEEKCKTLCDILRFGYAQGEIPQTDLTAFVKPMPLTAMRNFFDRGQILLFACVENSTNFAKRCAKKIFGTRRTPTAQEQANKKTEQAASFSAAQKQAGAEQEPYRATQTPPQKSFLSGSTVRNILLNILDVCASLLFVAAVVMVITPDLSSLIDGADILKINFLVLYAVFKIVVSLFSKPISRKIITLLLVACSVCTFFLAGEKFLLFVILCLLLYFAFEYSCGLRTKSILAKIVGIALLSCIGYVAANIALNPDNRATFFQICESIATMHIPLPKI